MLKMKIILSVFSLLIITSCQPAKNIETIDYKGWKNCYRLSNGTIEIIVVPQIARIISYSLAGKQNIFWENIKFSGKPSNIKAKKWQNYGGYKLWPAPEKAWKWPPDPILDAGKCEVKILSNKCIRLTGMKSEKTGIRFIRDIRIFDKGPKVEIIQTMENISQKETEWGIWEVTQVKPKGRVIVPLPSSGKYWDFYDALKQDQWSIKDGMMYLNHTSDKNGKVFVQGDSGWIAYELNGFVYIKKFNPFTDEIFPEGEANTEVYTCKDYIELEVVNPLKKLKPDEKYSSTEYWYIYQTDTELNTDIELRNFVEEKLKKLK